MAEIKAERQTQIHLQINNIQKTIDESETLLNDLMQRLTPIVSENLPEPKTQPFPATDELCPLAYELNSLFNRLSIHNDRIEFLMNRLEI
jgi:tetrahydromethanopterin S-methyltransferase subunit B